MVRSTLGKLLLGLLAIALAPNAAPAVGVGSVVTSAGDSAFTGVENALANGNQDEITYLVPALENAGFRISQGKQKFENRISFSPGFGQLGKNDLFVFRVGFNPNTWLGYEINLGHNLASSLHALLHTFNVVLRYPIPWRAQPYATVGYGMMTVFPGQAINADPVTKNTVVAGGGLEIYIRDDIALRGEMRGATVLGQELGRDGTVAYSYREYTIGFSFYRNL